MILKCFASLGMLLGLLVVFAPPCRAQGVYLTLTSPKFGTIKGEPSQTSLGRQDTNECISYESELTVPISAATQLPSGKKSYKPLKIRKRVDRASHLLHTAAEQSANLQGTFRFYRANPMGNGTLAQFYTVEIRNAIISSLRQVVTLSPTEPMMEEVEFVFQEMLVTPASGNAGAGTGATSGAGETSNTTAGSKTPGRTLRLPPSLVIGQTSPVRLRFESLASVARGEVDGRVYTPAANEELLQLDFTWENTGKDTMQVSWSAAPMTLISGDGTRIDFNQAFGSPTTKQSVVQALPAGERMKLYTLFTVPKGFQPVKLVIQRENKDYEALVSR